MIAFEQYGTVIAWANQRHPEWRRGQTAVNVLTALRPDLEVGVCATPLDPFYQDERLEAFLSYIEEHWETGDL